MERKCQECGGGGAVPMRVNPDLDVASPVVDACAACWRAGRGVPFGVPVGEQKKRSPRLRELLDRVDLSNFPVGVRFEVLGCKSGCCLGVALSLLVRDRAMPEVWTTISSSASADANIGEDEFYEKLLRGVKNGLDHELREQFLVSNRRPFDPHLMP